MGMTLAVNVVQNHPSAAAAGHSKLLVPGYTLLASCKADDDLPVCHFELPDDKDRAVFIVPSAASGEHGNLTIIVAATGPIEVFEVPISDRKLWAHKWNTVVRWGPQRPYSKYQGGKRTSNSAPALSWYRNPQFRVRAVRKSDDAEEDQEDNTPRSARSYNPPLLQAFLVPLDKHQKVPVAVHVVANMTNRVDKVEENCMRHTLLASSGVAGAEYQVNSEVGAACAIPLPAPAASPESTSVRCSRRSSAEIEAEGSRFSRDRHGPRCPQKKQPGKAVAETANDCVFVVPSLASGELEGAFTLHLVCTYAMDIEQVH